MDTQEVEHEEEGLKKEKIDANAETDAMKESLKENEIDSLYSLVDIWHFARLVLSLSS